MTVKWANFRSSLSGPSGFTGDDADSVFCSGAVYGTDSAIGGVYPHGYVASATSTANDKSTYATSQHQAGFNTCTANVDSATYHIGGLTVGHTYRMYLSMGRLDLTISCGIVVYSGNRTGALYTLTGGSVTGGSLMDINGNVFASPALWTAGQTYQDIVATTTDFYFCKSTNNSYINAIGIEDVTGGGGGGSVSSKMLLGVGS